MRSGPEESAAGANDTTEIAALPREAVLLATEDGASIRLGGDGRLATDGERLYAIASATAGKVSVISRRADKEKVIANIRVADPSYDPFVYERTGPFKVKASNAALQVEASAEEAGPTGKAQASFEANGERWLAEVTPESGVLNAGGVVISSHGPLDHDADAALSALAHSPVFSNMAFVALDLACAPEAERLPPGASAALLLPLQLVMKHKIADPHAAFIYFADASSCGYLATIDEERRPAPSAALVSLPAESLIPAAFGYFPLDGEGALALRPADESKSSDGDAQ